MTEAELLEALAEAHGSLQDQGEGLTVAQLAETTGLGAPRLRIMLRDAIATGKVRVSKRRMVDISGRTQNVPSYVFLVDDAKRVSK